jgi:hypothetical protein
MDAEDLYGLPLERFTEERNALAKALRTEGRREEAAEVSKLRKPSVAAWAVNQLVRTQRRDVVALFEAGDALQEAQSRLLAGRGDADALRDAVEAERAALHELTEKARGLLSAEGHELTSAALQRVSDTLNAAALDEDLRARVHDGRLERELHHIGIGRLGATGRAKSGRPGKGTSKRSAAGRRAGDARQQQARSTQAAETRKAEAEARRRAERTAKELKAAQVRRDRAGADFRDAEESLRDADEALASAQQAADDAVRELEEQRRARRRG